MLHSDIPFILTRSFPESILLILGGFILLDLEIEKKKILQVGVLLGISITFIRMLPINMGVHTVFSIMMYAVLTIYLIGVKMIPAIIVTIQVWLGLMLSEAIYVPIAVGVLGIPYETLVSNTGFAGAVSTLPSLVIFMCIIILIKKFGQKHKNQNA